MLIPRPGESDDALGGLEPVGDGGKVGHFLVLTPRQFRQQSLRLAHPTGALAAEEFGAAAYVQQHPFQHFASAVVVAAICQQTGIKHL